MSIQTRSIPDKSLAMPEANVLARYARGHNGKKKKAPPINNTPKKAGRTARKLDGLFTGMVAAAEKKGDYAVLNSIKDIRGRMKRRTYSDRRLSGLFKVLKQYRDNPNSLKHDFQGFDATLNPKRIRQRLLAKSSAQGRAAAKGPLQDLMRHTPGSFQKEVFPLIAHLAHGHRPQAKVSKNKNEWLDRIPMDSASLASRSTLDRRDKRVAGLSPEGRRIAHELDGLLAHIELTAVVKDITNNTNSEKPSRAVSDLRKYLKENRYPREVSREILLALKEGIRNPQLPMLPKGGGIKKLHDTMSKNKQHAMHALLHDIQRHNRRTPRVLKAFSEIFTYAANRGERGSGIPLPQRRESALQAPQTTPPGKRSGTGAGETTQPDGKPFNSNFLDVDRPASPFEGKLTPTDGLSRGPVKDPSEWTRSRRGACHGTFSGCRYPTRSDLYLKRNIDALKQLPPGMEIPKDIADYVKGRKSSRFLSPVLQRTTKGLRIAQTQIDQRLLETGNSRISGKYAAGMLSQISGYVVGTPRSVGGELLKRSSMSIDKIVSAKYTDLPTGTEVVKQMDWLSRYVGVSNPVLSLQLEEKNTAVVRQLAALKPEKPVITEKEWADWSAVTEIMSRTIGGKKRVKALTAKLIENWKQDGMLQVKGPLTGDARKTALANQVQRSGMYLAQYITQGGDPTFAKELVAQLARSHQSIQGVDSREVAGMLRQSLVIGTKLSKLNLASFTSDLRVKPKGLFFGVTHPSPVAIGAQLKDKVLNGKFVSLAEKTKQLGKWGLLGKSGSFMIRNLGDGPKWIYFGTHYTSCSIYPHGKPLDKVAKWVNKIPGISNTAVTCPTVGTVAFKKTEKGENDWNIELGGVLPTFSFKTPLGRMFIFINSRVGDFAGVIQKSHKAPVTLSVNYGVAISASDLGEKGLFYGGKGLQVTGRLVRRLPVPKAKVVGAVLEGSGKGANIGSKLLKMYNNAGNSAWVGVGFRGDITFHKGGIAKIKLQDGTEIPFSGAPELFTEMFEKIMNSGDVE